jgi:hypothetical protein
MSQTYISDATFLPFNWSLFNSSLLGDVTQSFDWPNVILETISLFKFWNVYSLIWESKDMSKKETQIPTSKV